MTPLAAENFLFALGSIGLGFAGFSGLILTLRQSQRKWVPGEIAGFKFILQHSFGLTLFAFVPSLLLYSGLVERTIWRVANILLAVLFGILVLIQIVKLLGGARAASRAVLICLHTVPTLALLIIEAFAARSGSVFWYCFGLVYLLVQAAGQFWVFLIIYTKFDG